MPLFPSDFKKFKHLKSDDSTTTLQHPKGHQIIIAHKALSKDMKAQLEALSKVSKEVQTPNQAQEQQDQMPKMAEGGDDYSKAAASGVLGTQPKVTQEIEKGDDQYKHMQDYTGNPDVDVRTPDQQQRQIEANKKYGYAKGGNIQRYPDGGSVQQDDVAKQVTPDYAQGVPEDASPDAPKQSIPEQLGHAVRKHFENSPIYQSYKLGKVALPAVQQAAQEFAKGAGLTEQPQDQAQQDQSQEQPQAQAPVQPQQPSPLDPNKAQPSNLSPMDPSQAPDQSQGQVVAPAQAPAPQQAPQTMPSAPQPSTPAQKQIMTYADHKQQAMQELNAEDKAFQHDLVNGHITPKTYADLFADKSTLGKISSIFGLMMSGAGAGLSRQPNIAMSMMDNELSKDLEAQKQSKDNAISFLKLNQQGLMNKAQIAQMNMDTQVKQVALAKMNMNYAALHSLAEQAKQFPVGSDKWQQAQQQLAMLNASVQNDNYNLADRASSASAYYKMVLGNNQGNQEDPAIQIRKKQLVGAITPQQSEQALKEIGQTNNHVQLNQNALDSFDNVAKLSTIKSKVGEPIQNQRKIDALWNPMMDKLTKDTEGRVTPITVDMMASLKPTVLDDANTLALKRNKLNAILNGGLATPTLDSIGVSVNKGEKSGPTPGQGNQIREGATATNKQGQKIIFQNGRWSPYNGR